MNLHTLTPYTFSQLHFNLRGVALFFIHFYCYFLIKDRFIQAVFFRLNFTRG